MKYEYLVSAKVFSNGWLVSELDQVVTFEERRFTSADVNQVRGLLGRRGRVPGDLVVITGVFELAPVATPEPVRPMLSVNDVELLVADTEGKLDDAHPLDAEIALNDLLKRLRVLAGLDDPYPSTNEPMTIGRSDRCLIEAPHDASLCGKHEAHR